MPHITALVTGADRLENSDCAMTLEEIGAIEGVTRERIRQIINGALAKLKQNCMPELEVMREMAIEIRKNSGHAMCGVIR